MPDPARAKAGPRELRDADPAELRAVKGVCLDIDDTLSSSGKLTAEAFDALWRLRKAGFALVPVTGRPAGWCDHIARFWPVDAVVGENGAFTFFMEESIRRRIDTPAGADPAYRRKRLRDLAKEIQSRFPEARWASDQPYREHDLAIDVREDVPPWPPERIDELLGLCHERGAHAKLSSIHVNAWFGEYDKRKGFEYWLEDRGAPGIARGKAPAWEQWLYVGDSPNDEPMFAAFQSTVGVANLRGYLSRLHSPPRWLTSAPSGAGFAEMADLLIRASTGG